MLPQLNQPRPGARVAVLYDPANRSEVALDHQPISAAGDAIIGNRPELAEAAVMGMPMTDVIREAIAALQESSSQAMQAQPATSPPNDPVDRLERLAALKDRGFPNHASAFIRRRIDAYFAGAS